MMLTTGWRSWRGPPTNLPCHPIAIVDVGGRPFPLQTPRTPPPRAAAHPRPSNRQTAEAQASKPANPRARSDGDAAAAVVVPRVRHPAALPGAPGPPRARRRQTFRPRHATPRAPRCLPRRSSDLTGRRTMRADGGGARGGLGAARAGRAGSLWRYSRRYNKHWWCHHGGSPEVPALILAPAAARGGSEAPEGCAGCKKHDRDGGRERGERGAGLPPRRHGLGVGVKPRAGPHRRWCATGRLAGAWWACCGRAGGARGTRSARIFERLMLGRGTNPHPIASPCARRRRLCYQVPDPAAPAHRHLIQGAASPTLAHPLVPAWPCTSVSRIGRGPIGRVPAARGGGPR